MRRVAGGYGERQSSGRSLMKRWELFKGEKALGERQD